MTELNATGNTSGGQSFTDAQVDEYREQDRWLPVSFSSEITLKSWGEDVSSDNKSELRSHFVQ